MIFSGSEAFYKLFHMDAVIGHEKCHLAYVHMKEHDYAHTNILSRLYEFYGNQLIALSFKVGRVEQKNISKNIELKFFKNEFYESEKIICEIPVQKYFGTKINEWPKIFKRFIEESSSSIPKLKISIMNTSRVSISENTFLAKPLLSISRAILRYLLKINCQDNIDVDLVDPTHETQTIFNAMCREANPSGITISRERKFIFTRIINMVSFNTSIYSFF
uniref:MutS_I domain-containing protein n=1 Tax=Strongyloides venezuelensis TaxID=75913 RepID=A0A0K0F6T8_STRVS